MNPVSGPGVELQSATLRQYLSAGVAEVAEDRRRHLGEVAVQVQHRHRRGLGGAGGTVPDLTLGVVAPAVDRPVAADGDCVLRPFGAQSSTEELAAEQRNPEAAGTVVGVKASQEDLADGLAGSAFDDRQIQPVVVVDSGGVQPSNSSRLSFVWVPVSRYTSGSSAAAANAGASVTQTERRPTRSPVSVGLWAKEISAGRVVIVPGAPAPGPDIYWPCSPVLVANNAGLVARMAGEVEDLPVDTEDLLGVGKSIPSAGATQISRTMRRPPRIWSSVSVSGSVW